MESFFRFSLCPACLILFGLFGVDAQRQPNSFFLPTNVWRYFFCLTSPVIVLHPQILPSFTSFSLHCFLFRARTQLFSQASSHRVLHFLRPHLPVRRALDPFLFQYWNSLFSRPSSTWFALFIEALRRLTHF